MWDAAQLLTEFRIIIAGHTPRIDLYRGGL
jgi:hypothetical protein